jgi:hypothetical protein
MVVLMAFMDEIAYLNLASMNSVEYMEDKQEIKLAENLV